MSRIPVRLYGPAQVATGPADLIVMATVAVVTVAVVRHIHVYNPGSGSVNLTLSIGTDAAATRILDAFPVAEDVPLDLWCYYPLGSGEVVQAAASANNQLVITIGGDSLITGNPVD